MKKSYNKPDIYMTVFAANDVISNSGIGVIINWNSIDEGERYLDGTVIE